MKRIQRILAAFLSTITVITLITVPASAVSVNDSSVFLEQQITGSNGTCTLATMAMMLRRRAILNGSSDWTNITENSIKSDAWANGQGLKWTVDYAGMTAKMRGLSGSAEQKKNTLISLLNDHPEGIEIYNGNQPHAVLLTDYDASTGKFYCADPAGQAARIELSSSTLKPKDGDQDDKIAGINQYWYITNGTDSANGTVQLPNISISSNSSGKWTVTVPANYKLVCYTSANATKSAANYISAKTAPYTLTCTQQATLSNGKIRYFFTSGDGKNLWFDFTNSMSAVPSDNNPAKSYTVNFNANGGSVWQSSKTVTNGQKYGDLPMPSWDGYTFDGWFTSAVGGTLVTAATTVNLTGTQTLYAHWSENKETYTIYFDPDGGSVDINSKEVNYGEYYGELPTPYREGYKFEGWRTGRNGTGSIRLPGKKVTTKSDETLYAHWSLIDTRIRVHFDTNGGPDHGYLYYYEANDTYGNLPSTEWVGYTFDGWYTLANGGTKIYSSTKLIQNSEHTLYAHWTKEEESEPSTLTISGLKVTVSDGKIRASATVTSNYDLMDFSFSNGAAGVGLGSVGKNRKTFDYTYEVDYTNLAYDGAGTYTFWLTCTDMSGNSVTATYDYYLPGKDTPQYFNCNVGIFTVKGKTVNLYNNPGDSKRVDYFNLGQAVGSSYGVNMPDGTTWYQVSVTSKGNVIMVWLKYESDKMTIRNL